MRIGFTQLTGDLPVEKPYIAITVLGKVVDIVYKLACFFFRI